MLGIVNPEFPTKQLSRQIRGNGHKQNRQPLDTAFSKHQCIINLVGFEFIGYRISKIDTCISKLREGLWYFYTHDTADTTLLIIEIFRNGQSGSNSSCPQDESLAQTEMGHFYFQQKIKDDECVFSPQRCSTLKRNAILIISNSLMVKIIMVTNSGNLEKRMICFQEVIILKLWEILQLCSSSIQILVKFLP